MSAAATELTFRNINGASIVSNANIGIQVSIREGSSQGAVVYIEGHDATTTELGHFTMEIGRGDATFGSFSSINWIK